MKIKQGFKLISVAGEHMVVPLGMQTVDFQAMITLNETGAFLWKELQEACTQEALVTRVQDRYAVEEEKAKNDVEKFIAALKQEGLLDE